MKKVFQVTLMAAIFSAALFSCTQEVITPKVGGGGDQPIETKAKVGGGGDQPIETLTTLGGGGGQPIETKK